VVKRLKNLPSGFVIFGDDSEVNPNMSDILITFTKIICVLMGAMWL